MTKDDEHFRLWLAMRWDVSETDSGRSIWEVALRGIHKPEAAGYRASVLKKLAPIPITDNEGRVIAEAGAWEYEPKRIEDTAKRIVRGLFAYAYKVILPMDSDVKVFVDVHGTGDFGQLLRESPIYEPLLTAEPIIRGSHSEMIVKHAAAKDAPFTTAWFVALHGRAAFVALTLPAGGSRTDLE